MVQIGKAMKKTELPVILGQAAFEEQKSCDTAMWRKKENRFTKPQGDQRHKTVKCSEQSSERYSAEKKDFRNNTAEQSTLRTLIKTKAQFVENQICNKTTILLFWLAREQIWSFFQVMKSVQVCYIISILMRAICTVDKVNKCLFR